MSLLQRVERVQREAEAAKSATMVPVGPGPSVTSPARPRKSPRDDLLREVKMRLMEAVINASDLLLDKSTSDIRGRVEGIIDGIIVGEHVAVTRDERLRLIDDPFHEDARLGIAQAARKRVVLENRAQQTARQSASRTGVGVEALAGPSRLKALLQPSADA